MSVRKRAAGTFTRSMARRISRRSGWGALLMFALAIAAQTRNQNRRRKR